MSTELVGERKEDIKFVATRPPWVIDAVREAYATEAGGYEDPIAWLWEQLVCMDKRLGRATDAYDKLRKDTDEDRARLVAHSVGANYFTQEARAKRMAAREVAP